MNQQETRVGHPTEGVFMKCWRCQKTNELRYNGNGSLHCSNCNQDLIDINYEPSKIGENLL